MHHSTERFFEERKKADTMYFEMLAILRNDLKRSKGMYNFYVAWALIRWQAFPLWIIITYGLYSHDIIPGQSVLTVVMTRYEQTTTTIVSLIKKIQAVAFGYIVTLYLILNRNYWRNISLSMVFTHTNFII